MTPRMPNVNLINFVIYAVLCYYLKHSVLSRATEDLKMYLTGQVLFEKVIIQQNKVNGFLMIWLKLEMRLNDSRLVGILTWLASYMP